MTSNALGEPTTRPISPCINICELDESESLCVGCGRTVTEISNWLKIDAAARDAIWDELPDRLKKLKKPA